MDSQPSSPYVPPAAAKRAERNALRDEKLRDKIAKKEQEISETYDSYTRSREIIIENLRRMEIKHQSAIAQKKLTVDKWKTLLESYKKTA
jgi:molecular chaperone GrpE (heat shock protein)